MSPALTGRADLFRALVRGDGTLQAATAEMLGLEAAPVPWSRNRSKKPDSLKSGMKLEAFETVVDQLSVESGRCTTSFEPATMTFWRAESLKVLEPSQETDEPDPDELPSQEALPALRPNPKARVEFAPLARVNTLVTWLRHEIAELREGRQLDVRKTVEQIGQGRWLNRLPHRQRRVWGSKLFLVRDFSRRLMPFDRDFEMVIPLLEKVFPNESVLEARIWEEVEEPLVVDPLLNERLESLPPYGATVLVLTDLGLLGDADGYGDRKSAVKFWSEWGQELTRRGHRAVALCPVPEEAATAELVSSWQIIPWLSGRTIHSAGDVPNLVTSRCAADRILRLLSMAIRVEPGLLRAIRQLVPESRANPAVEALVWNDRRMSEQHPLGATMDPAEAARLLDELFATEDEALIRDAFALILAWHASLPEEIRFEEILRLGESRRSALFDPELFRHALAWFKKLKHEAVTQWTAKPRHESDHAWALRLATRFPEPERQRSKIGADLNRLAKLAARHSHGAKLPDFVPPIDAADPSLPVQTCRLSRAGDSINASVRSETGLQTNRRESPLATIRFRKRINIRSVIDTTDSRFDIERDFWDGEVPDWAADWGIDEFGLWVELWVSQAMTSFVGSPDELPDTDVKQRLRWIPSGTFLIGSPDGEPESYDDERPQHKVTISRGLWMSDTPCTQAFYQAVTGENPSKFKSADRPVEMVSWEDAQQFLNQLRSLEPGIEIGLPTEAEWEYACRAGTTTARYDEPLRSIAWFDENSDRDYDLDDGRGTHPVGQLAANSWGLYDILGNVREWCQDTADDRAYKRGAVTDPLVESSEASAYRVIRGGSWYSSAQYVRAAYRGRGSPEYRYYSLGFRCRVRGAEPSQVAVKQAGKGRSPERAVSRRSGKAEPREDSSPASGERQNAAGPAIEQTTWLQLIDRQDAITPVPQGPVAKIVSDVEELTLHRISRPGWASAIGRDEFGLWADLKVDGNESTNEGGSASGETSEFSTGFSPRFGSGDEGRPDSVDAASVASVRLRWIPPGRFMMGSPKDEPGRWDDQEFEPNPVEIPEGFWLFETSVTQTLWERVLGEDLNQSRFRSADRPVEEVSWHDCQKFCFALSKTAGLEVDLPSEAEWEYACRAGTTEATWAGPFEGESDTQAVLDAIAWYQGNSGAELDPDGETGTHPVGSKLPNPWGLYDMLGNVYEWCSDVSRRPGDSVPDEASASRVIRGGCWFSLAQDVRAAYRSWYSPENRDNDLGFRCRVREFKSGEEKFSDSASAERSQPEVEPGEDSGATS